MFQFYVNFQGPMGKPGPMGEDGIKGPPVSSCFV